MSNQIQNMIHSVLGDGARSSKFRCFISTNLDGSSKNAELDTLCKSAGFPGRITETIDYKHKGKSIPIPSQEKYTQTIELTFFTEENHTNRIYFDKWMNSMHHDTYSGNSSNYSSDQNIQDLAGNAISKIFGSISGGSKHPSLGVIGVSQLNYDMDSEVVQYMLYNAFPIDISAIQLSSDEINKVLEYTVTFAYTHYEINNVTGSVDIANKVKGAIQQMANDAAGFVIDKISNLPLIKDITNSIGDISGYIEGAIDKTTTKIKHFLD